MRLEIGNNNEKKYIRIVESIRVKNSNTGKNENRKKIIKNIGPVSRFDEQSEMRVYGYSIYE